MTWGVVAVAGASAVSGLVGASAARRAGAQQSAAAEQAAQAQLTGTRESNQLLRDMYLSNLGLQAPAIRSGQTALAALSGGLGLPVSYGPQPTRSGDVPATGAATSMDISQYDATPQEQQQAAQQYAGRFTETFKPSDLTMDPSYKFRLEQGLRALQAKGAATGMLQTGQGLRDITDYSQQLASTEYQSAYDRFMKNQETLYNRLAGIAGVGQQATGAATSAGAATAQSQASQTMAGTRAASDYATSAAAARAAGQVGGTSALTGGVNQGVSNWMTLQYLNRYPGVGSAVGTPQPTGVPPVNPVG